MIFYGAGLFWSLQVTDIAYFYSENKITFAVTQMEQLASEQFFRANR